MGFPVSFPKEIQWVRGKIARYPWLFDFVSTWAKAEQQQLTFHERMRLTQREDYYSNTALGGALDDIRPNKSFLGFHPHGCLANAWPHLES